jgi:thiamine-phosphate pyrophosphorylase
MKMTAASDLPRQRVTPARCQVYLTVPRAIPSDFAAILSAVLDAAPVACLRLPAFPEAVEFLRLAQSRNVAAILDGNADLARLEADGVHLTAGADYAAARRLLGEQAIVGVHCGNSRHVAMLAADAGADYVALDADLELVAWWAEVMVVPVVVDLGDDNARAAEFAAAGAEFVLVGSAVFDDPSGAPAAVAKLAAAIA